MSILPRPDRSPGRDARASRRHRGGGRRLLALGALGALLGTAVVPAPSAEAAPTVQAVSVTGADVAAAAQSRNALT